MALHNFNPSTRELIPGLVPLPFVENPVSRSREAYFMHNTGATHVLTADWPEKQERWDSPDAVRFPLRKINNVEYLIDGRATYAAMLEALETATGPEHFVILLGWGLSTDFVLVDVPSSRTSLHGLSMLQVFEKKAAQGVKIRVLLWNNNAPTEYTEWAIKNNLMQKIVIDLLNPPAPAPEETPRRALCILDSNTRTFGAHHQKILLVYGSEGLIGFLGGLDVAEDRVAATKARILIGSACIEVGAPLHDIHSRVCGQAAHDLLDLAITRWNCSRPVRAYVTPEEVASGSPTASGLSWGEEPGLPRGASQISLPRTGQEIEDLATLTAGARATRQGISTPHHTVRLGQTVGNPAIAKLVGNRAVSDAWAIIRHAIGQARKYIYVEDQYFWSETAARHLAAALPNIERLIVMVTYDAADQLSMNLRHACIDRLFESIKSSADKKKVGIYNRIDSFERYIHSKMLIIDDEVAIIGSANMNNRGYTYDSEVVGIFSDPNWDDPNGPRAGQWHALELNLARKLRMQVWAEHLRIAPERLFDPLAAAMYWEHPPPGANVMPCPYKAGDAGIVESSKHFWLDPIVWDPEEL